MKSAQRVPAADGGRPIVVRRREIDRFPRPAGGDFGSRRVLPFGLPAALGETLSVFCVDTTDRVIAITFDDGPHPIHTPRILDVLASAGTLATFFVLARQVQLYPEVAKRIVAEGHELALHGFDHRSLLTMSTTEAEADVRRARHVVQQLTGTRATLQRSPYGQQTFRQALRIRALGLTSVAWSSDAVDWVDDSETAIADRAIAGLFPGGILLLHDDRGDPETLGDGEDPPKFDRARVVQLVLAHLKREDYRALTVGGLLAGYPSVRSASKQKMFGS